jgi:hypothetical protein
VLGQIEATQEEAARLGLDVSARKKPATRPHFKPAARGGKAACNRPCAACPCRRTRRARAICRRGSRRAWTNSVCSAADLAGIAGSGAAGRVTVEDFEKFIAHLKSKN